MHGCLVANISVTSVELATNCHLTVLPAKDGQLLSSVEENRLIACELPSENLTEPSITDQHLDMAIDLIDAKLTARSQSVLKSRVGHFNSRG